MILPFFVHRNGANVNMFVAKASHLYWRRLLKIAGDFDAFPTSTGNGIKTALRNLYLFPLIFLKIEI